MNSEATKAASVTTKSVWLGYTRVGGTLSLRHDAMKGGVVILGRGADELAALFAYACNEVGLRTLVLDLEGRATENVSGYMSAYDLPRFLYDAMRVDGSARVHAQLAASAYACALDLSFEQEATLNDLIQTIANERGIASPASLVDLMQTIRSEGTGGGGGGRPADRLKRRLESLRTLNMIGEAGAVKEILEGSAVLRFRNAGSPEASEVAAALLVAKLLALLESPGEKGPEVVVFVDANRLFKSRPIFRRSQRLLTSFVSLPVPKVLASEISYALDEQFLETSSVRVLSSAAWNERGKGLMLTPNMFMMRNHPYGYEEAFVPRGFEAKRAEEGKEGGSAGGGTENAPGPGTGGDEGKGEDALVTLVLETIRANEGSTRASVASYLSGEFPRERVEKAIDELRAQGCIASSEQDNHADFPLNALRVTEEGGRRLRLGRVGGTGEDPGGDDGSTTEEEAN